MLKFALFFDQPQTIRSHLRADAYYATLTVTSLSQVRRLFTAFLAIPATYYFIVFKNLVSFNYVEVYPAELVF